MTLQLISIDPDNRPLPAEIVEFLEAGNEEVEKFIEARLDEPIMSFVPSNYETVYRSLRALSERPLLGGTTFCEWGAGLGIVCGMASRLGFHSYGIESQPDLVASGERLLKRFGFDVPLATGSFIPPDAERIADDLDGPAWLDLGCADGYEELQLDIEDFDVIFAYPWPGEEHVVERLFDYFGEVGSILVTYRGQEGVLVHRKTGARSPRSY